MKEIETWLSTRNADYNIGCMLYECYGKYASVKKLLRLRGDTELTREKLTACLRDILESQTKPQPQEKQKPLPQPDKPQAPTTTQTNCAVISDPVIEKLNAKWKPKYAEMAALHSRLLAVATKKQRYKLALQIDKLHKECASIWHERDTYLKTGKLPRKRRNRKPKENISNSELRILLNARCGLSQYKHKHLPEKQEALAKNPTSAKAQKALARVVSQIDKYEKTIAQDEQE